MTTAEQLLASADLCETGAHQAVIALRALGPRPETPPEAVLHWNQAEARLRGQMDRLTGLATNLAAASVLAALEAGAADLATLAKVSADAAARIKQIDRLSTLLTSLSRVLDAGLAVIAMAAAPSPATAAALATAVAALDSD